MPRVAAMTAVALVLLAARASAEPSIVVVSAEALASAERAHCANPRPSPDGRWLAFEVDRADKSREQKLLDLKRGGDARRLRPKGQTSDLLRLIRKRKHGGASGPATSVCHELCWAPAGPVRYALSCANRQGNYDVFHASNTVQVPTKLTRHAANDFLPAFGGPGGETVAFVSARSGNGDLYLLDLSGGSRTDSKPTRLTTDATSAEVSPVWSPDGRGLFYVRHARTGEDDLYYLRVAGKGGSKPIRVTRSPGSEVNPSWSPDGRRYAFFASRGKKNTFDLFTGHAKRLATSGEGGPDHTRLVGDVVKPDRAGPGWTPDGQGVLYVRHEDPHNPLEIRWLDGEGKGTTVRLKTGTIQNRDPAVVALADGRWLVTWIAQARAGAREKRWNQVFGARIAAESLRGGAARAAP